MKNNLLLLSAMVIVLLSACKKDETNTPGEQQTNLLAGAIEFTGTYPATAQVHYTSGENSVKVTAFQGQVLVFFDVSITESTATDIITKQGGEIISKIPVAGYYMVKVPNLGLSSFISYMNSDSRVKLSIPNVPGLLSSDVQLLDGCGSGLWQNEDHAEKVTMALTSCGGTKESCSNISVDGFAGGVSLDNILHGILRIANANAEGPIMINISSAGGYGGGEWPVQDHDGKLAGEWEWYDFMTSLIKIVGSLDENHRSRMVVTVASGNGEMPLRDMLDEIRKTAEFKKVLRDNFLIVSNRRDTSTNLCGNYAGDDYDVAVTDNSLAINGTSFAAPCAMGIIQEIINSKGVNAQDALKIAKLATHTDEDHLLKLESALDMYTTVKSYSTYSGNNYTFVFGPYVQNPCTQNSYYDVAPTFFWNGANGTATIPTNFNRKVVAGSCTLVGVTQDYFTIDMVLTGSGTNINGTGSGNFYSGSSPSPWKLDATFSGAVNIAGDISGTLTLSLFDQEFHSMPITLFRI